MVEEIYATYEDTAGNLNWHGTETGHHIIKRQNPISNYQIPEKCKHCGYYYNFMCRAKQCVKGVQSISEAKPLSYDEMEKIRIKLQEMIMEIYGARPSTGMR